MSSGILGASRTAISAAVATSTVFIKVKSLSDSSFFYVPPFAKPQTKRSSELHLKIYQNCKFVLDVSVQLRIR